VGERKPVGRSVNYIWVLALLASIALAAQHPVFEPPKDLEWTISKLHPGNTEKQATALLGQPVKTSKIPIDDDRYFDAMIWDTVSMYFVDGHPHSVGGKRLDYEGSTVVEAGQSHEEVRQSLGQPDLVSEEFYVYDRGPYIRVFFTEDRVQFVELLCSCAGPTCAPLL
jgi:outer membrane protein assembly factor BamE (lipoprotein component of BamABCDE complex)